MKKKVGKKNEEKKVEEGEEGNSGKEKGKNNLLN